MLDKRSLMAYLNGLVLPHLDYADVVWGDQPGLTTQMKHMQSFQKYVAKHPRTFRCFNSKISQQHGYNTRNGYMPKFSRPRTE